MFNATIKSLWGHKLRVLLTAAVVVVGVSFMAGTLVLTDTMTNTFNGLFSSLYKDTDGVVRSAQTIKAQGPQEERAKVPESMVATLQKVDGVKAAEGFVMGQAQFIDKAGKAIGDPGFGAPTFGFSWSTVPELNPYTLSEGKAPSGPNQVVSDKATATKAGYKVGDNVKVISTTQGTQEFELVGIAKFGDQDSALGATTAFFDLPTSQSFVGKPGELSQVGLVANDGVSQEDLATRVRAVLPPGDEVLTGEAFTKEQQDQVAQGLQFFGTFMLVFAFISLIVGSFIIYNTFSIVVAQRTKELALLRAVGASKAQVRRSLLAEALVTGVLASGLGLLGGIFFSSVLKGLLDAVGFQLPSTGVTITFWSMFWAFVTGLIVTVVSATFPARKAAKVPPIAALRDVSIDRTNASVGRIVAGVVITVLGVASLMAGLFADIPNRVSLVGLGALLTFVGIAVLGPVYARPFANVLGAPVASLRGITGRLARQNSSRNPRRTSATASALMVGVGLVCALLVMSSSAKASITDVLEKNFTGDFVVTTGSFGGGGLSPKLAEELRKVPELGVVSPARAAQAEIAGKAEPFVLVADPGTLPKVLDPETKQGRFEDLATPGTIAVHQKYAADKGWTIGQMIPVKFGETGDKELKLVATYERGDLLGQTMLGIPTWEQNSSNQTDLQIYTKLNPGADVAAARTAIEKLTVDYPTAKVQDITQYKEATLAPIDILFSLMTVLLLLAIVIALFGIMITLTLSVHERTRELGLLRAVGMTRGQARTTVRWESVIIAVFGTGLGLAIGLFFGWSIVKALVDQGFTTFVIPVGGMIGLVVFAMVMGVVLAIWPAYRASKLNVLSALATE